MFNTSMNPPGAEAMHPMHLNSPGGRQGMFKSQGACPWCRLILVISIISIFYFFISAFQIRCTYN